MTKRQRRTLLWAAVIITAAWVLAWTGHRLATRARMTPEKVISYLGSTDLAVLKGEERVAALQAFADKMNALNSVERRQVREQPEWGKWVGQTTDPEKEALFEATFPSGLRQMLVAFERQSPEQRRRTIDTAVARLKESGRLEGMPSQPGMPPLSPRLTERIREVGLQAFFSESSPQAKVEAAPLLEELQRQMQSGRWGR